MKSLAFLFPSLVLLASTILNAQVKITGVLYSTPDADDRVRLTNFGASSVDVSNWYLCSRFIYHQINGSSAIFPQMVVEGGTLNIPPNSHLWLSGKPLIDTDADLGLYIDIMDNSGNFANPAFMRDFVQWGSIAGGREGVAVMAGLWIAGLFVPNGDPGFGIEYIGDPSTTPNLPSDWMINVILGVNDDNVSIPDKFILAQNYPNPFNPATTIRYSLSNDVLVILKVYNTLGQEVATLVSEFQNAGFKSVVWDGKNSEGYSVSSGIYVYRIRAGNFVDTKKLLLLK